MLGSVGGVFFGGNRLVKSLVLLVFFLLFAVSGCDVSSCCCKQGWERAGGWGGGNATVVVKDLHAHEHTCQCTQADAWPMMVSNARKKRLESHHVYPILVSLCFASMVDLCSLRLLVASHCTKAEATSDVGPLHSSEDDSLKNNDRTSTKKQPSHA